MSIDDPVKNSLPELSQLDDDSNNVEATPEVLAQDTTQLDLPVANASSPSSIADGANSDTTPAPEAPIAPFKDENDDPYHPSSDVDMIEPDVEADEQSKSKSLSPLTSSPQASEDQKSIAGDVNIKSEVTGETSDITAATATSTAPTPEKAPSEATPDVASIKQETTEPAPAADPHLEQEEEQLDEEQDPLPPRKRTRQTHAILIPSYASWFNMKKIHRIERESLPEFFETNHPSKSPKIYANYRNFMINAYRLNPNEYLTLTSCRRNLVGDVGTLMRVHRFLNKWGLINYQVNPQLKPGYAVEKLPNGSAVGLPYTGDYHVQYDTPRGLFPFDTHKPTGDRIDVQKLKELVGPRQKDEGALGLDLDEPAPKKQKTASAASDDWTETQTADLVAGIKEHKNDWYKIAKIVGKTPQECILKFLKLPIEDKFIDGKDFGIFKYASNFPVSAVDNPVISNLTFMTQLVESDVAKAASERASRAVDDIIVDNVKKQYGDEAAVKEEDSPKQNGTADGNALKEAATTTFGLVGARSHLFANYEEREMQKLTQTIVNQQLNKLEVKLGKVAELEKVYERERKHLAQQQQEVFVDRLALTKSTINITKKLNSVIELLQKGDNPDNAAKILQEVQSFIYKPSSHALVEVEDEKKPPEENGSADSKEAAKAQVPISLEAPRSFKVWAP